MRHKWAVVAVALCVVVTVAAVAYAVGKASTPDVIRARGFEVTDAEGTVWARFGLDSYGDIGLSLLDKTGELRAFMGQGNIGLCDSSGIQSVCLNSSPQLSLDDGPSGPSVLLGVGPEGSFWLNLSDEDRFNRATLSLDTDGNPALVLQGGAERRRLELVLSDEGDPTSRLLDEEGEVIWSAP